MKAHSTMTTEEEKAWLEANSLPVFHTRAVSPPPSRPTVRCAVCGSKTAKKDSTPDYAQICVACDGAYQRAPCNSRGFRTHLRRPYSPKPGDRLWFQCGKCGRLVAIFGTGGLKVQPGKRAGLNARFGTAWFWCHPKRCGAKYSVKLARLPQIGEVVLGITV